MFPDQADPVEKTWTGDFQQRPDAGTPLQFRKETLLSVAFQQSLGPTACPPSMLRLEQWHWQAISHDAQDAATWGSLQQ